MKQLPFAFLCIILASYLNICVAQTPNKLHYQLILRYDDGMRLYIDVDKNGRLMVIANKPPYSEFKPSIHNGEAKII